MSVEAQNLMSHEWSRWQGHVVNGVFPLGRCLGCSEHSGVFVTKSSSSNPREVAIKLLPASREHQELQRPRWARVGGLAHPHLLPVYDWGACQLDGLPYLYVVMEYADQTLAQLLLQRALTGEEARDMLSPILDAYAFLHRQELIHGQLKPANILVVGDQLKLASDTIRSVSDKALSPPSAYDPPEGREGRSSTATDIFALGVNLFEALTRRAPVSSLAHRNAIELPADFPSEFREPVSHCLSLRPEDRPEVSKLQAWLKGQPVRWATELPKPAATIEPREPRLAKPAAPRTPPAELKERPRPVAPKAQIGKPRALIAALWAVAILLSGAGIGYYRAHRSSASPASGASADLAAPNATPVPPAEQPAQPAPPTKAVRSDASTPFALHEVIPDVPRSAARTIHGHVKVSVRSIVAPDGSVSAVLADHSGPSKYFQRLAVEAAKRWAFPPVHTATSRLVEIQFDFSRDGTTAQAVPAR